jgi:prefoldin subunit 5
MIFFKVPIGKLAFMEGILYHTNETLVSVGDNYFVEKTASQTREFISRRKECTYIL